MNRILRLTIILSAMMAMVALPKANAAGRNGKRSKEDVVKEQYEKKLEEQEEKHQKTIEAAAEIEDSLRAEVKRLKEKKNSMADYVQYVGEKATEVAGITTKTLHEASETTQEYIQNIKESTTEVYEESVKPAVEELQRSAEAFVEPHAKRYAPLAKTYAEQVQSWFLNVYDDAKYWFFFYRQHIIDVLANQDNVSEEGAAYIVDLFVFTIAFASIFYTGFYIAIPLTFRLVYLGTCCHCFGCFCNCCGLCKKPRRRKSKRN